MSAIAIGKEGIYNVQIMEEKQTILAAGAGASTKTVDPETDRIERVFNVKSIEDYIGRIEEMIERKRTGLPQGGVIYDQLVKKGTKDIYGAEVKAWQEIEEGK